MKSAVLSLGPDGMAIDFSPTRVLESFSFVLEGPPQERWLAVPGFDGYEVSDFGRVRSWLCGHIGKRRAAPRVLLGTRHPDGYRYLSLSKNAVEHRWCVHRIVLTAFVGECPAGHECRHLDGNPSNNALANLAWGTPAENDADRVRHGTMPSGDKHWHIRKPESTTAGMRHPGRKLSLDQVEEIRRSSDAQKLLAGRYGVTRQTINRIKRGDLWR